MDLLGMIMEAVAPHQDSLAEKTGVSSSQVVDIMSMIGPMMINKLAQNAASPEGAASLEKALEDHDGSVIDDVGDAIENADTEDGEKIVGHILGNEKNSAVEKVAEKSGVSADKVMSVMAMVAPLLMGAMGKQRLTSAGSSGVMGMLSGFLDKNGDGSIVDDVMKMGMGFIKGK